MKRVLIAAVILLCVIAGYEVHRRATHPQRASQGATVVSRDDAKVEATPDAAADKHVADLLLQPPLAPLPATLQQVDIDGEHADLVFARRAGIAVSQHDGGVSVIDLARAGVLSRDGTRQVVWSVSPNGRVYVRAMPHEAYKSGVELRDTMTHATLAVIDKVDPMTWEWGPDATAIFISNERDAVPVFVDFAAGTRQRLPVDLELVQRILPAPSSQTRFLLPDLRKIFVVEIQRTGAGWRAAVEAQTPAPDGVSVDFFMAVTSDGRTAVEARGHDLHLLDLQTHAWHSVRLPGDANAAKVVATIDPDRMVIEAFDGDYIFGLSTGSVTRIDDYRVDNVLWIPSLRRNATLMGRVLMPLPEIPTR